MAVAVKRPPVCWYDSSETRLGVFRCNHIHASRNNGHLGANSRIAEDSIKYEQLSYDREVDRVIEDPLFAEYQDSFGIRQVKMATRSVIFGLFCFLFLFLLGG
jgi:hypothetical protein